MAKCVSREKGWPYCGWILTGSLAKPLFLFEKKLREANDPNAEPIGKDLARLMALLDKLFITTEKDAGEQHIPGYEAWIHKCSEKWSPDDCFCTDNMKMPPFRKGETDLLTTLWLKSMVLFEGK